MSEAATESEAPDEVTPFVEEDREIAYRSEATAQVSLGPSGRPAVVAPSGATGRRKEAVARVRITPGSGQWKINGNDLSPQGDWNGAIHVDTKATINGRSGNMPVDVPSLGSIPLTFTCADGSLNLSTPKSPFVWLFR